MNPRGRFAKPFGLLFEIDVDAVKKNRHAIGLVLLIQRQRQIERNHEHRVALTTQRGHERIIAETISAKHGSRAGGYLNNVQAFTCMFPWNLPVRCSSQHYPNLPRRP